MAENNDENLFSETEEIVLYGKKVIKLFEQAKNALKKRDLGKYSEIDYQLKIELEQENEKYKKLMTSNFNDFKIWQDINQLYSEYKDSIGFNNMVLVVNQVHSNEYNNLKYLKDYTRSIKYLQDFGNFKIIKPTDETKEEVLCRAVEIDALRNVLEKLTDFIGKYFFTGEMTEWINQLIELKFDILIQNRILCEEIYLDAITPIYFDYKYYCYYKNKLNDKNIVYKQNAYTLFSKYYKEFMGSIINQTSDNSFVIFYQFMLQEFLNPFDVEEIQSMEENLNEVETKKQVLKKVFSNSEKKKYNGEDNYGK